jgi:hypothetical protein
LTHFFYISQVHFDPLELFSMLIGAAVHDLDHPGLNNNYEIATRSDRALVCVRQWRGGSGWGTVG